MPPVASTEELPNVSLSVGENKHLYSNFSKQNQKIDKIMESLTEKIVKKMQEMDLVVEKFELEMEKKYESD